MTVVANAGWHPGASSEVHVRAVGPMAPRRARGIPSKRCAAGTCWRRFPETRRTARGPELSMRCLCLVSTNCRMISIIEGIMRPRRGRGENHSLPEKLEARERVGREATASTVVTDTNS